MKVVLSVGNSVIPNFQAKNNISDSHKIRQKKYEQEKIYTKKQLEGLMISVALSAAFLGGAIVYLDNRSKLRILKNTREQVKTLTYNNENLTKVNERLKEIAQRGKDALSDILEGDLAPKDRRDKILNDLKEKIENGDYGYDIKNPPITGKGGATVHPDAIPLPSSAGTTNRINIKELDIPQIASDGRFDYEVPMSDEVKITHMKSADFSPVKCQPTNISESYADSVKWNNDKIARDILQNFFDGHGQTLDGVRFHFEPVSNGKYNVSIEGKSTYTPDKAVYIGESTKHTNARAAGNYGEGLKMATLKLLKDGGAEDVRIASDNWKVTYFLTDGNLSDKRVLSYSLDKTGGYNGNYIEFETSDKNLLNSLRATINRFYNSGNTHFKCPDFENDILGIKNLHKGEKGGIYIAGQRFEFDGQFDSLDGIVIFIKEKLPVKVVDISRDRTSLNTADIQGIGSWLARNENMSKDDKVKLLKSLERYWDEKEYDKKTPMDSFLEYFLNLVNLASDNNKLYIKFPENNISYSLATPDVVYDLRLKGYRVCKSYFLNVGMPTIRNVLGDARAHDVVIPNDVQKKKILILKEAINKLSPSLKDKHFSSDELNTKIYLFDRNSIKDRKMYSDCNAEAIVDNHVSKGFWIDKNYINSASFSDALETALHELSHKAGGDESADFSYKLTEVNKDAIDQLLNDIKSRNEMQALNTLWENLS